MTKNPEDEKLVTRVAVKGILDIVIPFPQHKMKTLKNRLVRAIDDLPAVLPNSRPSRQRSTGGKAGEIKSPEEIERAIEYLEELRDSHNIDLGGNLKAFQTHIDLLLLILNREQDTWDEEKIFGKSE